MGSKFFKNICLALSYVCIGMTYDYSVEYHLNRSNHNKMCKIIWWYEQIMNTQTKKRLIRKSTLNTLVLLLAQWNGKGEACGFPYPKRCYLGFVRTICQRNFVWISKKIHKVKVGGRIASLLSFKAFPFIYFPNNRLLESFGLVGVGRTLGGHDLSPTPAGWLLPRKDYF